MIRIVALSVLVVLAAPWPGAQTVAPAGLADAASVDALALAAADVLAGGTRLATPDGSASSRFGFSVAVSGTHAIVGAYAFESSRGAAFSFEYDGTTWVPKNRILANDGVAGAQFGWAVAISGDRAIVTAPNDQGRGSAYAFVWTGAAWVQRAKLTPQGTLDGAYGLSVAMSGDRAIVGMSSDVGTTVRGSAFVYAASGASWTQQAQLLASDGGPGDNFGFSVAISGDRALVGAFRANVERGAAYFFEVAGTTWTQRQRVAPTDTTGDRFGRSVALSGDRAIVGADEGGTGGSAGGKAFIYGRSGTTWTLQQRIVASDRPTRFVDRWDERFGAAVAISGDLAVVGAQYARVDPTQTSGAVERGAAYLFAYDTSWRETAKLVAPDWAPNDRFGAAVGIDGEAALVGAWVKDAGSGAAYVFGTASETVIVVNSTDDDPDPAPADGLCDVDAGMAGEQCTLRAAIQTANAVPGGDRVTVDISALRLRGGHATISLGAPLPTVTEALVLDGAASGGPPLVLVDGGGTTENGVVLTAGESTVRGFAFVNFTGAAVRIEGPGGNTVAGNYIGVDPDGTTLRGNHHGVHIDASRANTVGGATAADRNVIGVPPSPEGTPIREAAKGIYIEGDDADANVITGNYIGVAATGTAMLADPAARRSGYGILVIGADSTVIGGAAPGAGQAPANVIGGLSSGVLISHATGEGLPAAAIDTRILGNLIGTNATGTDSLSNGTAVLLLGGALFTQVGGASAAEGNVLSGNQGFGILMTDGGSVAGNGNEPFPPIGTRIVGNTIGLAAGGLSPLGNFTGIAAGGEEMPDGTRSPGVRGVEIGAPGYPRNLIAGNRLIGIFVFGAGYPDYDDPDSTPEEFALSYVLIRNNYLGLRADGQPAIALGDSLDIGVLVVDGARAVIGFENGRNVIGGHDIGLFLASDRNLVYSNYIGTDPSGVAARPNLYGLILTGGDNILGRPPEDGQPYTGDYVLRWGNLVSGNDYVGMALAPGIPEPDPDGLRHDGGLRLPGLSALRLPDLGAAGEQAALRGGDEGGPAFLIGNRIGVSATGAALPNGTGFEPDPEVPEVETGAGLYAVGGDSYLLWNVIAGNVGDGLGVYETFEGNDARANLIGNFIGVSVTPDGASDDLPNTRDGIFNLGGDVRIGLAPGDEFPVPGGSPRNVVWNSGRNGITTASFGNLYVSGGSFLNNAGLGIDVGIAGPDGPGAPGGHLQAPELFLPTLVVADGDTTLTFPGRTPPAVPGDGAITHRVEHTLSGSCDASGYGEGAAAFTALTTAPGERYTVSIPLDDAGDQIRRLAELGATVTATVTQVLAPSGGLPPRYLTSEFSACVLLALPEEVAEGNVAEGETGEVLPGDNGLGVTVTANPSLAARARGAGTLTSARYPLAPQAAPLAGAATAPDGSTVTPTVVSPVRFWALAADGLDDITYTACLDVDGLTGVTDPAQLLVVTRARPGLPWTPRASTLSGTRLCAADLTGFGELAIGADGAVNPVPSEPDPAALPSALAMAAWPNPTPGRATVTVAIPVSGSVRVDVFDTVGRGVAVLHDGPLAAGDHPLAFDTSRLPSGVYIVRASTPASVLTRRLTVAR